MIVCNGACMHLRMQIFRMRMAIIWECSDKQLLDRAFTAFKTMERKMLLDYVSLPTTLSGYYELVLCHPISQRESTEAETPRVVQFRGMHLHNVSA